MVQRWDPFGELRQMQSAMDRIWRGYGGARRESPNASDESQGTYMENWAVPLDVSRSGEDFLIRASLPGVSPEDIQVSIEDNVLSIRGQTSEQHQESSGNYLMRERRTGSFYRSLRLPDSVDADKVEPTYDHGVLTISIPKAEAKKARSLQIKVGAKEALEGK